MSYLDMKRLRAFIKEVTRAISPLVNLYVLLKCLQSKQLRTILQQPISDVNKSNYILQSCGVNVGKCCISGRARIQL